MKFIRKHALAMSAAAYVGAYSSSAQANDFNNIAQNINASITNLPGLLTSLAYLFGLLFAVLGILKVKDHVEQPQQTPLREGAVRLAAGGALFALPIVSEAMFETIDDGGAGAAAEAATLNAAGFNVQ